MKVVLLSVLLVVLVASVFSYRDPFFKRIPKFDETNPRPGGRAPGREFPFRKKIFAMSERGGRGHVNNGYGGGNSAFAMSERLVNAAYAIVMSEADAMTERGSRYLSDSERSSGRDHAHNGGYGGGNTGIALADLANGGGGKGGSGGKGGNNGGGRGGSGRGNANNGGGKSGNSGFALADLANGGGSRGGSSRGGSSSSRGGSSSGRGGRGHANNGGSSRGGGGSRMALSDRLIHVALHLADYAAAEDKQSMADSEFFGPRGGGRPPGHHENFGGFTWFSDAENKKKRGGGRPNGHHEDMTEYIAESEIYNRRGSRPPGPPANLADSEWYYGPRKGYGLNDIISRPFATASDSEALGPRGGGRPPGHHYDWFSDAEGKPRGGGRPNGHHE